MEQGEIVVELLKHTAFDDHHTCCVDLIHFGPTGTANKAHSTFTEIFLHVSGEGIIFINDQPCRLSSGEVVLVKKGDKHRFSVDKNLVVYSVCLPKFDYKDYIE